MFQAIIVRIWFVIPALLVMCSGASASGPYAGKRILWVESYHEGFVWSDGVAAGVRKVLKQSGAMLRIIHLDTKRNGSEEFGLKAGKDALEAMREFKPDVVMASEDNAQRYFVVPYLKGRKMPVVFCGINWDASEYGYPAPNVTGMLEVNLLGEARAMLQRFAKGERVGYIAADTESERKNLDIYNARDFSGKLHGFLVRTFGDFPAQFEAVQKEADMIIMGGNGGMDSWDDSSARTFLATATRVPTGSFDEYLAPYVVFTFAKDPEEQGEWMASTALRILDGAQPASIPIVENKRVRLFVNLKLARAAGLVLPVTLLKTATIIGKDQ